MEKNDGGPAFPIPIENPIKRYSSLAEGYGGMSLRDYFAAKALSLDEGVWEGKGDESFAEMANNCYRIADAMLAEREK